MGMLVRCGHCKKIYDVGKVEVVGRYADCSEWISPCCGLRVDSRGRGPFGKPTPDTEELTPEEERDFREFGDVPIEVLVEFGMSYSIRRPPMERPDDQS